MEQGALRRAPRQLLRSQVVVSSISEALAEVVANSLDAGASEVSVELDLAGGLCFRVQDNGSGIAAAGLELVGRRLLASSKRGPCSSAVPAMLGYRGEALSAICETSVVEITSRAAGSFETHAVVLRGGQAVKQGLALEQRSRQGTVVSVRDMFFNQPVRRKTLLAEGLGREVERCKQAVLRLALLRHSVAFTLFDRSIRACLLSLAKGRPQAESVADFLGHPAEAIARVEQAAAGKYGISGYAALPPLGHPNTSRQCVYVNRRWVKAAPVSKLLDGLFQQLYKANMRVQWVQGEGLQQVHKAANRHAAFVLHVSCAAAEYELAHEADGALIQFRDWQPLLAAVRQALLGAWRLQLSDTLLKELEALEQGGRGISSAAVAGNGTQGLGPAEAAGGVGSGGPAGLQVAQQGAASSFQLWLQDSQTEPQLPAVLPANKGSGCWSGKQQETAAAELSVPPPKHDSSQSRQRGSGRGRQLAGATHRQPVMASRLVRYNAALAESSEPMNCGPGEQVAQPAGGAAEGREQADEERHSKRARSGPRTLVFEGSTLQQPLQQQRQQQQQQQQQWWQQLPREQPWEQHQQWQQEQWLQRPQRQVDELAPPSNRTLDFLHEQQIPVQQRVWYAAGDQGSLVLSRLGCPGWGGQQQQMEQCQHMEQQRWQQQWRQQGRQQQDIIPGQAAPTGCNPELDALLGTQRLPASGVCRGSERCGWLVADAAADQDAMLPWEQEHFNGSWGRSLGTDVPIAQDQRAAGVCPHLGQAVQGGLGEPPAARASHTFLTVEEQQLLQSAAASPPCKPCRQRPQSAPPHERRKRGAVRAAALPLPLNKGSVAGRRLAAAVPAAVDGLDARLSGDMPARGRLQQGPPMQQQQAQQQPQQPSKPQPPPPQCAGLGTQESNSSRDAGGAPQAATAVPAEQLKQQPQTLQCTAMQPNKTKHAGPPLQAAAAEAPAHQPSSLPPMSTRPQPSFLQPQAGLDALLSSWRPPAGRPSGLGRSGASSRPAQPLAGSAAAADGLDSILTLSAVATASFAQLAPAALSRSQLAAGRALHQLDTKFIPVVCGSDGSRGNISGGRGGVLLALVDQHAADERVQLERLRDQLLGLDGQPRQVHSEPLCAPLPLGLTEAEQQLMEAYQHKVAAWGWRWRQPGGASSGAGAASPVLTHAPSLWGTLLTATDMKLYLHHLSDTCGAGGLPAAVVRVLNSKACRGAIMFGDSLEQGQCQELLDNLKQTQLCFSCAHGRPTTVPLVDLKLLGRALQLRQKAALLPDRSNGMGRGAAAGGGSLAGLKARLQQALGAAHASGN